MIEDFLSNFRGYMIQTFDDREYCEKDPSLVTCGKPGKYTDEVLRNLNAKGAGIYFSPNAFDGRRKKELCTGVNAWFMECDWCPKEDQKKMLDCSSLEPSIIVESKKSLHTFWLSIGASIENFTEIQRRLIYNFSADPSCKDVTRVLRIPGFNHNKQKEPFLVKVIKYRPDLKYTENQMLEAFKPEPKVPVTQPQMPSNNSGQKTLWDVMANIDNKSMLCRLSGSRMVNGEVFTFRRRPTGGEYIDVNGKPADAWIDEMGKIGSGKGASPTWVQWLGYYDKTKGEIAQWFKENCKESITIGIPMNEDVGFKEVTTKSFNLDRYLDANVKSFTWGVPRLDEEATLIQEGQYIVLAGETNAGKTAFALQMAIENARKFKVLYLSLEMQNEGLALRYAQSRLGLKPQDWKKRNYNKDEIEKIVHELPEGLKFVNLEAYDCVDVQLIKSVIERGNYDLAFIDNLGFIDAQGESENEKQKQISRSLKFLANQSSTSMICLHHFRKSNGEKVKIRPLSALLGTSKIAHDVDMAIQVLRNQEENATADEKEVFSVVIQKDRNFGVTGIYHIRYKNGLFIN